MKKLSLKTQRRACLQPRMECNGENPVVALTELILEQAAVQYGTMLNLASQLTGPC